MSNEQNIEIGDFYWVMPACDPDDEPWERKVQPGRYAGNGKWNLLAVEGDDWEVDWVGGKLPPAPTLS